MRRRIEASIFRKRKLLGASLLYVILMVVLLQLGIREVPDSRQDTSSTFVGEVVSVVHTASGYQLRVRKRLQDKNILRRTYRGVVCYLDSQPSCRIGDVVCVRGTISVPKKSTNPGQFNTYIYHKSRGVDGVAYQPQVTCVADLQQRRLLLPVRLGKQVLRWLEGLGRIGATIIQTYAPAGQAGVLNAMLFGDKSGLPDAISSLYQANGISHILAISGLHVGFVSGMLYRLLRRLGISYVTSGVVGIGMTFAYGYMTGAADASMRAAIMLAVVMIGAMIGRTSDSLTAMGISMAIHVTIRAEKVYDAAFLLSYGAVVAIGYFFPLLRRMCKARAKWIDGMLVTIAIWLVTMPVMLYFYGTFTPYALLLNVVVIPLMTPVLACGLLGSLFAGVAAALPVGQVMLCMLAKGFITVAGGCVWLMTAMCYRVQRLPCACVILGAMTRRQAVCYYGLLVLLAGLCWLAPRARRERYRWVVCAGCVVTLQLCLLWCYRPRMDRMTMLDVGQGDSILLSTAKGGHILVDGGSTSQSRVGEYVIAPALRYYGIRRLDAVLITHADADHTNGILYLLEQSAAQGTRIDRLVLSVCAKESAAYQPYLEAASRYGIRVEYIESRDCLAVAGLQMTCLSPTSKVQADNENDMSLVMLARYPAYTVLLTGDIGSAVEESLLADGTLGCVDVLKVAHHGSKYASSDAFLQRVTPRLALISCGLENRYGHPHADALDRLAKTGCAIYRTDCEGAIELLYKQNRLQLYRYQ